MSETRKPFWIGVFLLGGVALLAAALLLLGREGWRGGARPYVVYFTGSLDGLDVGADVTYRGVKVGSVREIRLTYERELSDVVMPVIISISPDDGQGQRLDEVIERLVERGLRAQLQTQSLLTGKAVVALDVLPGQPGYIPEHNETGLPVIPSVPSRVDQAANLLRDLVASLRELPLQEMVLSTNRTLAAIERLAVSPQLHDGLGNLAATLANVEQLTRQLQHQLPPILDNAQRSGAELDKTLREFRRAAEAAELAMRELQAVAGSGRQTLGPESELRYELLRALEQLGEASKALQRTAEQIQQRPQSLIFGK